MVLLSLVLVPLLIFLEVVDHFRRRLIRAMSSMNDDLCGEECAIENRFILTKKKTFCLSDYSFSIVYRRPHVESHLAVCRKQI